MDLKARQEALSAMGCHESLNELSLRPGLQRLNIVAFLLERLLHPSNLSHVLSKVDDMGPSSSNLSDEERQALKYVSLLRQIGFATNADAVMGCGSTQGSLAFLDKLMSIVRQRDGPVTRNNSCSTSNRASMDPTDTVPAPGAPSAGVSGVKLSPATHMPLLDFACANFPQLTSESCQALPSDMAKATAKNMPYADELLASCRGRSEAFDQGIAALSDRVHGLSTQVSSVDDAAWDSLQSGVTSGLREYLTSIAVFSDVYTRELGVWSESLQPAQTCGIGQQAAAMLDSYRRTSTVLGSVATISRLQEALAASKPPLAAFKPSVLARISEGARQETAMLAQEVQVLSKAAAGAREQRLRDAECDLDVASEADQSGAGAGQHQAGQGGAGRQGLSMEAPHGSLHTGVAATSASPMDWD